MELTYRRALAAKQRESTRRLLPYMTVATLGRILLDLDVAGDAASLALREIVTGEIQKREDPDGEVTR